MKALILSLFALGFYGVSYSIFVSSLNPDARITVDPHCGIAPLSITISDSSIHRTTNTWIFNNLSSN